MTREEFKAKLQDVIFEYATDGAPSRNSNFCDHQVMGKLDDVALTLDEAFWHLGKDKTRFGNCVDFFWRHISDAVDGGHAGVREWVTDDTSKEPTVRHRYFDENYQLKINKGIGDPFSQ